jgi:hypothetical protein
MKNILKDLKVLPVIGKKTYLRRFKSLFERILVNFHASGSGSAFPIRSRSRIAKSMLIHVDPDPDPQHWFLF